MPTVRVLSNDSAGLFRLHLRRLGLVADSVAREADAQAWSALLTGVARDELAAAKLQADGLRVVEGDAERAPGTLILSGTRAQARALAARLDAAGAGELARALFQALDEPKPQPTQIGSRRFEWGSRTFVMAIVNVTPDSFSDGGRFFSTDSAVAHGERLAEEGADLLDVGGESTRPGAEPVSAEQEIERVVPVIERLAKRTDVPISIDTTKASVAKAALEAGASLVNDISGFRFDPEMAPTLARSGAAACAMHIQGVPRTMQHQPSYLDVVGEVIEYLQASVALAERCGVARERILIDPGIGFGKTGGHNLFLLRNLRQLKSLGLPILVGASRKRFVGTITGKEQPQDRLAGSLAVHAAAVMNGADVVRVHDVEVTVAAVKMIDAVARAAEGGLSFSS
ncbi:MAG: dihydropteroate synthase [Myxococcales bacterium]|jgi:dihydropteroate synthase